MIRAAALLFPCLLLASGASAQDAAAGRALAEKVCTECHVIDSADVQRKGVAPGLLAISQMPSVTELSLKVFLQTPHAGMPAIMLSQRELDDVTAFILGLKGRI